MAQGGRIDYTIGFNVDKSGLSDLKKQLKEMNTMTAKEVQLNNPRLDMKEAMSALKKAQVAAYEVEKAMNQAFNPKLGITNLEKLQSSLNRLNLNDIQQRFSAIGAKGSEAFLNIAKSALTTNVNLKQTSKFIDKIGTTLINTVKWQFSSSIVNRFTGAIQQAYGYVKHLDTSLNDIRIVTGKSADEMERFAVQANKTAQTLGRSTTQATEAALIYYQQGLSDKEAQARMETTLKAANVTGQSAQAVSEELTAVWNGYKVNTEETEAAVDKLAAVAATTASDLQELSTGMSKVASAANAMGVDMDQLNAQIATIISVTRQAPESVGTALKTIYARLADLKLGDTDEDGLGLGDVSGTLDKVGIAVLDANGDLREMGDVIEDVAAKWNTWTSAQQTAIAQVMAGKRQYNNLVALFENWDMYSNALDTSRNSLGTLQNQQDIYMESTEAHIQMLKTEWEDLYDSIIDESAIKGITDGLRNVLNIVTNIIDGIGGGKTLITGLIALIGTKLGKNLSEIIVPFINNIKNAKTNAEQLALVLKNTQTIAQSNGFGDKATKAMADAQLKMSQYWDLMTVEEKNASMEAVKEIGYWEQRQVEIDATKQKLTEYLKEAGTQTQKTHLKDGSQLFDSEKSSLNTESIVNRVKENERPVKELNKAYKDLSSTIDNLNKKGIKKFSGESDENFKKLQNSLNRIKDTFNKVNTKANRELLPKETFTQAENGIERLQKRLDELKKGNTRKILTNEDIDSIYQLEETIQSLSGAYVDLEGKAEGLAQEEAKVADGSRKAAEALGEQDKQLRRQIDSYSKLVGGVSSLVFAMQSLSNIGSIWTNDDLEGGEKFLQLLSSSVIAIPMLLGGIKNLALGINGLMLGVKGEAAAEIVLTGIKGKLTKVILGETAAAAGFAAVVGPLTVGLVALTGVLVGLGIAGKVHQKNLENEAEATRRAADQQEEYLNTLKAQKEGIDEVAKSYENLHSQIKNNSISTEDAKNTIYDLCKQHGLQDLAVKTLIEDYENLSDVITQAQKEIDKSLAEGYKKQAEAEKVAAKASIKANSKESERDRINGIDTVDLSDPFTGIAQWSQGYKALQEFGDKLNLNLSEIDSWGHFDLEQLMEAYAKDAQGLWNLIDTYGNEDLFKNMADYLSKHKEDFESYREAYQNEFNYENQVIANETFNTNNIKDLDSFIAEREKLSETLSKSITDPKELKTFVSQYINGIDEIKDYAKEADIIDAILGSATQQTTWIDPTKTKLHALAQGREVSEKENQWDAQSGWDQNTINNILNRAKEQVLLDTAAGVSPEDWKNWFFAGWDENAIIDELIRREQVAQEQSLKIFQEKAGQLSEGIGTSINSAITNSLDITTEDYTKLLDQLTELKEYYPELTEEIDAFSTAGLVGTEHWIQAAYQLQQAIDGIEFANLNQKANEARDALQDMFTKTVGDTPGEMATIHVTPDDSEFQEAIDNILDAEYAIDVEVHADAERDFTQLVNSLEQADSMADKIGEDFIVAADDIRELNQAFPGILQDIEYLGDGTIKLNEDIARSAMAAAADEEAASTQALVTKLQNSADELRAKADVYDAMADIAHEANIGMISDDEAKLKINAEMDEIQVENDKIASQSELDNAALIANDSQEKGSINAANWTESYQEAANASAEFAKRAIANAQAVADNNLGAVRGADFGSNYTGNNVNASEATSGSGIKTNANGGYDWAATEDQFRNMAEAARQEANDIEGMIVAAAAKGTESLKKAGEVGRGSGSGGSDSGKEADHEEYLEREEDIYHQINQELEQIESTLGRIQKLEDHSWGASAKANLEEENKLLEKQIEKLHEKKALQERDLSTRRKQLEDVGISFTEDGSAMTNAEAQLNALYAHYNTMVDTYNAMSAAEQETYKAQLEAEKDRIKKIEDKISQYESTYSDYQSVLDEIMDKHFEQIEKQVQTFNHDIELHLELDEAKEEWNDFWYDIVQDVEDTDFGGQIAKSIDKLKLLVGGFGVDVSKSTIAQLTGHLNETINQVKMQIASATRGGEDSIFGEDTALSKETLENYMKTLMEKVQAAKEEIENIGENYLKILDSAQDKIDKQVEGFEAINSHLEHNAKLIKMISGEDSYEALNNMYNQQYDNNMKLVETQRTSKEYWEKQMAVEKAMMESAEKGSEDYKTHEEAYEKASENYRKAIADLDSTVEKTIEDLNTWKDNQMAAINDTFDKAISKGYGLDMVEKEWKLINEQANRYLDNVERATGMVDLNNEFNKVLNTTNMSIKAQQELNQMRDEEIAKLNQKAKISQFDLDEVKARLEIRKQEIALEDAQKNKSNLRLRRDSQGNYSYQYTGDDSKVEEASEGLMSAKREWYELVKKRNIELADAVLENRKNLQKELQDLEGMYFENDEEKRKKQLEIIQRYTDIEKDIMKDAEDAKQIFFDGTAKFFEDVEDASILPQWESTIEQMISDWSSGGAESFTGAVAAGIEQIDTVQSEYVRRTDELLNKAGIDYQNLKNNGIDPTTDALAEMTDTNEELCDSLSEVNNLLEENAEKLKEAEEGYNNLKDAAVNAIKEAQQMIEELAQTVIRSNQQVQASLQSAQNAASIIGNSTYRPSGDGGGSGGGTGGGSGTGSGNRIISEPWKLSAYDDRGFMLTGYPKTYTNKESMKREAKSLAAKYAIALTGNGKVLTLNPKTDSQQIREYKINMFKSGGYTGTWQGSNKLDELMSGKLALLHQKELVLNETDTKNLLKAVELLRNISIEKIANSILNAAKTSANILTNVNTGTAQSLASSVTNETDNSYRNMTVNADFSGVRSADAIYEALRNLENVSMQGSF